MKATMVFCALFLLLGCQKNLLVDDDDVSNTAAFHNRSIGASANELLSASKFKSLVIEVQYMPGYAPDATAINHLQSFISTHLNKPNGITVVTKEIPASTNTTLSRNEIADIEKNNRAVYSGGDQIAIYILYTNGGFTDANSLGIAYRNTSIAILGKKLHENSGGIGRPSRAKLEATVLEHEVGHLLGLVDIGSPMQTPHKANGNHCNNQGCLMYFSAETTDIAGFLITGNIPSLDANCIADLRANGGK